MSPPDPTDLAWRRSVDSRIASAEEELDLLLCPDGRLAALESRPVPSPNPDGGPMTTDNPTPSALLATAEKRLRYWASVKLAPMIPALEAAALAAELDRLREELATAREAAAFACAASNKFKAAFEEMLLSRDAWMKHAGDQVTRTSEILAERDALQSRLTGMNEIYAKLQESWADATTKAMRAESRLDAMWREPTDADTASLASVIQAWDHKQSHTIKVWKHVRDTLLADTVQEPAVTPAQVAPDPSATAPAPTLYRAPPVGKCQACGNAHDYPKPATEETTTSAAPANTSVWCDSPVLLRLRYALASNYLVSLNAQDCDAILSELGMLRAKVGTVQEPSPAASLPPPALDKTGDALSEEAALAPAPRCAKCLDRGEYLLWIERPGGPPGNQLVRCEMRCEMCQPPTSPTPVPKPPVTTDADGLMRILSAAQHWARHATGTAGTESIHSEDCALCERWLPSSVCDMNGTTCPIAQDTGTHGCHFDAWAAVNDSVFQHGKDSPEFQAAARGMLLYLLDLAMRAEVEL